MLPSLFRPLLTALLLSGLALSASAQTSAATPAPTPASPALTPPNATYAAQAASHAGTPATKSHYRAIYQLDSNDPKLIGQTLRSMKNALEDPRLKGRLELELVVFGGGTVGGDCYDNAQAESLWSRLKTEVLAVREWPVLADLTDAQASVAG